MLEANLNLLKTRFPVVLERILSTTKQELIHFKFEGKQLLSTRNGKKFATYGKDNAEKLIERWFSSLSLKQESLYAVTGFGDGSHIRYLLNNTKGGTYLLVAEKDPALLRETFSRLDCSDILANERFLLGTGECDDLFFKDLQAAAMLSLSEVNSIVFSPLHCADENYYDKARNEMIRQYLVVRPLMEVNLRTGTNLQENTLKNIPYMGNSPDIGELTGLFKDTPFILVGAGPSLDESIDFLKEVQNRAIIVTSNSPFRKLINSGIKPHLVLTADPLSPTMHGFRNVDVGNIPLACPFSAYPEIVKLFSGRIISWVTFSPIVDLLKDFLGKKPGTPIMEQGTVSGCVLDLSRVLGCKKVLFVGQDMCVRKDGKYYTDDSHYSDYGDHFSSNLDGHRLPGNTSDEVIVEGRLYVYLKIFEKFIKENSQVCYRNLARTGVRISGADYIDFETASNWIGESSSSIPFAEKINALLKNSTKTPQLDEIYRGLVGFLEELLKLSLSLAIKTEKLPAKYSSSNYSKNKKVLELLSESNKVNTLIEENPKYWHALLDGKTKSQLAIYKRIVRDIDSPNQNWNSIIKNKEYFWAISEGCNWLLGKFMEERHIEPKV
jgi:hypothetical protein